MQISAVNNINNKTFNAQFKISGNTELLSKEAIQNFEQRVKALGTPADELFFNITNKLDKNNKICTLVNKQYIFFLKHIYKAGNNNFDLLYGDIEERKKGVFSLINKAIDEAYLAFKRGM